MNNDIYTDKIKIALTIVGAELDFINSVNTLLYTLALNEEDIKDIDYNEDYHKAFIQLNNLYDFLQYDYFPQLTPDKLKTFETCLNNYKRHVYILDDLITCKQILLKVMSLSKFHDIVRFNYDDEYTD